MNNADKNTISNLRSRWKAETAQLTDEELLAEYKDFSQSDWHGNNDERFLEWLGVTN